MNLDIQSMIQSFSADNIKAIDMQKGPSVAKEKRGIFTPGKIIQLLAIIDEMQRK